MAPTFGASTTQQQRENARLERERERLEKERLEREEQNQLTEEQREEIKEAVSLSRFAPDVVAPFERPGRCEQGACMYVLLLIWEKREEDEGKKEDRSWENGKMQNTSS